MEIRMIKTFEMIVKLGSFQRAAEALQYSQPTVTTHIKKLEEEIGIELLVRGKTITTTEAGRLFFERAGKLLKEYDYLTSAVDEFRDGDAGTVRIGGSEPWLSQFMPSLISSFMERYPNVQVSVLSAGSDKLNELLVEDQIDFALCTEPRPRVETVFEPLLAEPMALLVHEHHPMAGKQEIYVKELQNERFLLTMGSCPIRVKVESILSSQLENQLRQSVQVSNITSLKYYVQTNLGIALAPIVAISPEIPATLIKHVIDLEERFQIGILKKRYDPPNGTAVLRLLAEVEEFLTARNVRNEIR